MDVYSSAENGTDHKHDHDQKIDQLSVSSVNSSEIGTGVKQVEAIAKTWTLTTLIIAYLGLFLLSNVTSLENQTTYLLTPIATSAFGHHSLLSAVVVVQQIILAVIKPPMAAISNVFGRWTGFSISIFLFVIGYVMQAGSNNVRTYAAASIFYSSGSTGLQILMTIFISDTSSLRWRVLMQAIIQYVPSIWTFWVGPTIAGDLSVGNLWRWGYGMWAIILPVAYIPLCVSLGMSSFKARKLGLMPKSVYSGRSPWQVLKALWFDLDFFGLILLSAALCLILLPLILAATASHGWRNPSIIAMIVVGGIVLLVFPFWERSKTLAPKAFFPRDVFKQRTVVCGTLIAFFYYMAFYMSVQPYFTSYLYVVPNLSVKTAGRIAETFNVSASVTAVVVGLLVSLTKHYKYWVTFGACIYLMGIGLMIRYRNENTTVGSLVGTQIAVGIGGGILNQPVLLGVQASASHSEMAAVTAVFLTILEVGGAVGTAVSGAIWTSSIQSKLRAYLPPSAQGEVEAIFGSVVTASTMYPPGTPERAAIDRAYYETMRILLICAVCLSVPVIPLSLLMKNYKLDKIDQKVEGLVVGGQKETTGASQRQIENKEVVYEQASTQRPSRFWRRG